MEIYTRKFELIDRMIGKRNIIVHSYDRIDDAIVYGVLKKSLVDMTKLTAHLKIIYAKAPELTSPNPLLH